MGIPQKRVKPIFFIKQSFQTLIIIFNEERRLFKKVTLVQNFIQIVFLNYYLNFV